MHEMKIELLIVHRSNPRCVCHVEPNCQVCSFFFQVVTKASRLMLQILIPRLARIACVLLHTLDTPGNCVLEYPLHSLMGIHLCKIS